MIRNSVIIVAGGTGIRMNTGTPKQFLLLNGLPVLMHTIRAFSLADESMNIVLALPEEHFATWSDLCLLHDFTVPHEVVAGGTTRFGSVRNALEKIPSGSWVAVHDGARPLVSPELIRRTFAEAFLHGNAVPVVPVSESLRETSDGSSHPVDRTRFRLIQTPQVFAADTLKKAYQSAPGDDYGDDATVVELTGEAIYLSEGDPHNLKITIMADMAMAGALMLQSLR